MNIIIAITILLLLFIIIIASLRHCYRFDNKFAPPDYNKSNCDEQAKKDLNLTIIDDYLTEEEINELMRLGQNNTTRSYVMGTNKEEKSAVRTSENTFFNVRDNPKLQNLLNRVSKKTGLPVENQESIQFLKYNKDKFYRQHYDACLDNTPNCKADRKRGGLRANTHMFYLSDIDGGGETSFPNLGKFVAPKKGRMVSFNPIQYVKGKARHNPCSLHAAHPPTGNKPKFNATIWSRENAFK